MSLSVDSRYRGAVYVIRCTGRIVSGQEIGVLEAALERGLRDGNRFVLDMGEVSRLDSTGMGLLVRFLSSARNRGGDLRLSSPPPLIAELLRVTKLATVFRVYGTEEEAIASLLKGVAATAERAGSTGPKVLFVDPSIDLCAFVRALLGQYGYDVSSTCQAYDARLLLMAGDFAYLVLGPDAGKLPLDDIEGSLRSLAASPATIQMEADFNCEDAERAATYLLRRLRGEATSEGEVNSMKKSSSGS